VRSPIRAVQHVIRWLLLKLWLEPLENHLRSIHLACNEQASFPVRSLRWLRDLGWLLMSFGRVNVNRYTGDQWTVICIQDDFTHSKNELRDVLFPERPHMEPVSREFVWRLNAHIPAWLEQADLVVADINHLIHLDSAHARYRFDVPPWVLLELDINKPLDEILMSMTLMRRRDIRNAGKVGFTSRFSRDLSDLEFFYHEMYVPYISRRFEDRAILASFESKKAMFDHGGLIIVDYEGVPSAGLLGYVTGDTFNIGSIGIRRDHYELVKKGIVTTLNWLAIQWAKQEGYRHVNFGMTRSRIYDGGFEAKRNWGTRIQQHLLDHTDWVFLARAIPSSLASHLNRAGMITLEDGSFQCVLIKDDVNSPSTDEVRRLSKIAESVGVAGIELM
jgi:hypothetical protein